MTADLAAQAARLWRRHVSAWADAFRRLGRRDRSYERAMYGIRVESLDALRRYDAEHGTHLARLAADPERWQL